VLIHGLGGSADWWRHNVDALAARHLVLAINLAVPVDFEAVAAELAAWIETEAGEPVHLVGNSMGGHVAIHLAARRPDLVRTLTLVDSTGVPFAIDPGTHISKLLVPRGLLSFLRVLARDFLRSGPRAILRGLLRLFRDDARPLLRTLRMPVLLLWGERDPLVPAEYAKRMLAEVSHARLEVIERAGHVPMWEQPEAFNRALLGFIDGEADEFSWRLSGYVDGIAHREAGRARHAVLVHGLGMSSAYFVRFAAALHAHGVEAIAPDLPGFGESANARAMSPHEQAEALAAWADKLGIRDALWIGHSLGCNTVAHVAAMRPDLVRDVAYIGPLWSQTLPRLFCALLLDALREPLALWPFVLRAYWRCGLARWFASVRHAVDDIAQAPPPSARMLAGARDPLPALRDLTRVPGAHACHFSDAEATAREVRRSGARPSPPPARR
jgi:pimeloyl-ACP methyl ester carboxylesterase